LEIGAEKEIKKERKKEINGVSKTEKLRRSIAGARL